MTSIVVYKSNAVSKLIELCQIHNSFKKDQLLVGFNDWFARSMCFCQPKREARQWYRQNFHCKWNFEYEDYLDNWILLFMGHIILNFRSTSHQIWKPITTCGVPNLQFHYFRIPKMSLLIMNLYIWYCLIWRICVLFGMVFHSIKIIAPTMYNQ